MNLYAVEYGIVHESRVAGDANFYKKHQTDPTHVMAPNFIAAVNIAESFCDKDVELLRVTLLSEKVIVAQDLNARRGS